MPTSPTLIRTINDRHIELLGLLWVIINYVIVIVIVFNNVIIYIFQSYQILYYVFCYFYLSNYIKLYRCDFLEIYLKLSGVVVKVVVVLVIDGKAMPTLSFSSLLIFILF